jgi:hypothetical protein
MLGWFRQSSRADYGCLLTSPGVYPFRQSQSSTSKRHEPVCFYDGTWGNKWGNMPHRFQPIST